VPARSAPARVRSVTPPSVAARIRSRFARSIRPATWTRARLSSAGSCRGTRTS